jgi:hypothetical protein
MSRTAKPWLRCKFRRAANSFSNLNRSEMSLEATPPREPDRIVRLGTVKISAAMQRYWRRTVTTPTARSGNRESADGAATPLDTPQFRAENCRAHAAECQATAHRCSGLIKKQYEDMARRWLMAAEQVVHISMGR